MTVEDTNKTVENDGVKPDGDTTTKPKFTPEQQEAKITELTAEAEKHRKKAAEYRDELNQLKKSGNAEIDSLTTRLAELEKDRADAKIAALKATYSLTDDDVALFTEDFEYNERLAKRLAGASSTEPPTVGAHVPGEGLHTSPPVDEVANFSKQLFS